MADRYPDYDVLAKRHTPSWNAQTRAVVDERLAMGDRDDVLDPRLRRTLRAVATRIAPAPESRPPTNAWALVLQKIAEDKSDGYRPDGLPGTRESWTKGLAAIDAEAQARHGRAFADCDAAQMDAILHALEQGGLGGAAWDGLDPKLFWTWRLLPDIVAAHWAHPSAWSAMGFGGPASPRGYVRLGANRRDPWEAAEAGDGAAVPAEVRNRHVG